MMEHEPQTLRELFLSKSTRHVLEEMVARGSLENMLLYGPPGVGKTSCSEVLVRELHLEHVLRINGSQDRSLKSLHSKLHEFVRWRTSTQKVVIIDEADALSLELQYALRRIVEESRARFIFICNYIERIIEPLRSRLLMVQFGPISSKKYIKFIRKMHVYFHGEDLLLDDAAIMRMRQDLRGDIRKSILHIHHRSYIQWKDCTPEVSFEHLAEATDHIPEQEAIRLLGAYELANVYLQNGGDPALNTHIKRLVSNCILRKPCVSPPSESNKSS